MRYHASKNNPFHFHFLVPKVAFRYLEAALFEPPPLMFQAARYFFVSRWGAGVIKEIQRKERSQKARLKKVRKMLQEQEASIKNAVKATELKKSFDLVLYHAPKKGFSTGNIRKKVLRYTYTPGKNPWGETDWWEVDRPFSMDGVEFHSGEWPSIAENMEGTNYYGPLFLEEVIWEVERILDSLKSFKPVVTQAVNARKSTANLLSKGTSYDDSLCRLNLTGWVLWERRVPDGNERRVLESEMATRQTLRMKFAPQETGSTETSEFVAHWSPSKWEIVFAGMSGYWSVRSLLDRRGVIDKAQFKQALRELDSTVVHEMKHYAQSLLKELLALSEIAGHPRLTDPAIADVGGIPAGKEWTQWDPQEQKWVDQRIPHMLRDVEFETRLGDEVDRFENAVADITLATEKRGIREKTWLRSFFDLFTGRKSPKPPVNFLPPWKPSSWFEYLRKEDRKRYQTAMTKFAAELDRLGYMKRMERGRLPVSIPQHPAWGLPITRYVSDTVGWRSYETQVQALREYGRFVDNLTIDQLRRHRTLVRDTGAREYWLTPRWQDHIKNPMSNADLDARRTEAAQLEHPRYR